MWSNINVLFPVLFQNAKRKSTTNYQGGDFQALTKIAYTVRGFVK